MATLATKTFRTWARNSSTACCSCAGKEKVCFKQNNSIEREHKTRNLWSYLIIPVMCHSNNTWNFRRGGGRERGSTKMWTKFHCKKYWKRYVFFCKMEIVTSNIGVVRDNVTNWHIGEGWDLKSVKQVSRIIWMAS